MIWNELSVSEDSALVIRHASITLNGSTALSIKTYSSGGRQGSQDGEQSQQERVKVAEGMDVRLSLDEARMLDDKAMNQQQQQQLQQQQQSATTTTTTMKVTKNGSANHSPLSSVSRVPIALNTATDDGSQHEADQTEQMMRRREKDLADGKENEKVAPNKHRRTNSNEKSADGSNNVKSTDGSNNVKSGDPSTAPAFVSPLVANKEALLLDTHNRSNSSHAHRVKREGSASKSPKREQKDGGRDGGSERSEKRRHGHHHSRSNSKQQLQQLDGSGAAGTKDDQAAAAKGKSPTSRSHHRTHGDHHHSSRATRDQQQQPHVNGNPATASLPQTSSLSSASISTSASSLSLPTTNAKRQQQLQQSARATEVEGVMMEEDDMENYSEELDEEFEFEDAAEQARLAYEAALNPFHLVVERAPLNCEKLGDNTTDSSLRQLTGTRLSMAVCLFLSFFPFHLFLFAFFFFFFF
jgi:hypothetical protein